MATTANSKLQITDLDYVNIKNNLIDFLKNYKNGDNEQIFKDYNFSGSALSVLLDVLTYNTQYNAYYLNMVGNEMFLDTSLQRGSVVSHAKLLNYTPKSVIAPSATINVTFSGIPENVKNLTLPRYSTFSSKPVSGKSYSFVNTDLYTVDVNAGVATFNNVIIKQGKVLTLNYNYTSTSNPKGTFEIPDSNVDTSTILVQVYPSSTSTNYEVYTLVSDYLNLNGESKIYFLEENMDGNYVVSFGDGILGKKLTEGCVVVINYLSTKAKESEGANNFVLTTSIDDYYGAVTSVSPSTGGKDRETIDQIKYAAPKAFFSNNRAVSKEDYIAIIEQNKIGITFDAVNVWGGEENIPPVYGQVFISLKPTGAYELTQTQKQRLIQEVIKPISVLTVEPTIVTPDYTYLQVICNVVYDPTKTNYTQNQIEELIKTTIKTFGNEILNTFNSTFTVSDLTARIEISNPSIVTSEIKLNIQKKLYPDLINSKTYNLYFGTELEKGMFQSGVKSYPSMLYKDPGNVTITRDGVYIEEIPSSTGGVESISIINPGFGYQVAPSVTIIGDGTGATATAYINTNGTIKSIQVTNTGTNYTEATIKITPASNDTTGKLGAAIAQIEGQTGELRLYYYNAKGVKTIMKSIGSINYKQGLITLNNFSPVNINSDLGQLTITANPVTTLVSSSYNRIITIDDYDPNSIIVNVIAKS